jgi:Undecaprenyl-phosphate glucose phosphotransferase
MSISNSEAQLSELVPAGNKTAASRNFRYRLSRRIAADLVGVADVVAIVLGFYLPVLIYSQAGGILADWMLLTQAGVAAGLIVHMFLRLNGMYDTDMMHDFPLRPGLIFAVLAATIFALMGLGLPHAIRDGHLWICFCVALSGSFTLMLLVRAIVHPLFAHLTKAGYFDERVAVFGAGQIARRVHEHLSNKQLGIHFIGVFDDRMGDDRLNPEGLAVAGRLDDLIEVARANEIDRIVIALPQSADQRISHIAQKLQALPASLHIVTHISSDLVEDGPAHNVSAIGSVGLLDVKKKPLSGWSPLIKRAEDIILGTLLLILALPLFPIIALAIRLDSPGPVLFRQLRSGYNQRPFEVLKFRTMHVSDATDESRQAAPGDARITRVGRILRRTSLDELPQLFNVIKGEMSLVGPRPHLLEHDRQFAAILATYPHRHQVKPGLTGLAQVRGHRGVTRSASHVEARVSSDLQYIRDWSLGLDLQILVRTIWAVITGRNAH